jgi:hypothetical protein
LRPSALVLLLMIQKKTAAKDEQYCKGQGNQGNSTTASSHVSGEQISMGVVNN